MATSKICLDTDIVIDHLRGRPQAFVNAVLQFNPYITSVTLFELESADFLSGRQMRNSCSAFIAL